MNTDFSIGIVTYLGRFENYFKPLIRKVNFLFPDRDIIVWINGHYAQERQIAYLREITTFLKSYPNIRYMTNLEHQPLTRGFNTIIFLSQSHYILMLNDDVGLFLEFRYNFEKLWPFPKIFTLNNSWSHFVISKDIVRRVGWFDERFPGIGFEDTDYAIRLARQGIPLEDIKIHGLFDYSAPPDDATWGDFSVISLGKYSQANWEFFQKKWRPVDSPPNPHHETFRVKAIGCEWVLNPDPDLETVPAYYPLECLDIQEGQGSTGKYSFSLPGIKIISFLHSLYWRLRLSVGVRMRQLLGSRWLDLKVALKRFENWHDS